MRCTLKLDWPPGHDIDSDKSLCKATHFPMGVCTTRVGWDLLTGIHFLPIITSKHLLITVLMSTKEQYSIYS